MSNRFVRKFGFFTLALLACFAVMVTPAHACGGRMDCLQFDGYEYLENIVYYRIQSRCDHTVTLTLCTEMDVCTKHQIQPGGGRIMLCDRFMDPPHVCREREAGLRRLLQNR